MNPQQQSQAELDRLRTENARLLARLGETEDHADQLAAELSETNQGVLALYTELDDRALALREASDLKSRFLSYMSHEFRTPLGAIRSLTRILLDRMDGPLSAEQEKQITFIQTAAAELNEMVNDLLDLAKIEAGRVSISPAWFEMVDLFAALRGMFKPILASTAVSLTFVEPVNVPRLYTDDKRLSQVLRNYISNALKFTPEGEVRVAAECNDSQHVTFRVSDTGIGIAPEHLASVFEDFVQIESPLQRRFRGTGLGLALSKRVTEMLGGRVGATSELGKGSSFWVSVPIRYMATDADKNESQQRKEPEHAK